DNRLFLLCPVGLLVTHTYTHTRTHARAHTHTHTPTTTTHNNTNRNTHTHRHTHTHRDTQTHTILFSPCISVICECSGLEWLHLLTRRKKYELRVDMEDFEGGKVHAQYSSFSVASEAEGYQLDVSGYIDGGAGRDGHTHTQTHTHKHTHSGVRACTHSCKHTHTHTNMHTHTHTPTTTHKLIPPHRTTRA